MKKYDVTAMGELLIDFTENGFSKQGNPLFEANPGGAPCNVLAMLSKLGYKTAFVGKVGNDIFGRQLKVAIEEVGIENGFLLVDEKIHTTLAIVHTLEDGEQRFFFLSESGGRYDAYKDEVPENLIANSRMFHFGTLSMTHEGVRAATKKAVQIARKSDCIISFDPNLRPPLWKNMDEAREQVLWGLKNCDILKISDNEIIWLTGKKNYTEGVRWICERYQIPLIFVSMGKDGSRAYYKGHMIEVKAFLNPNTIETTGAGDTFMGCVLGTILEKGLENLTEKDLHEMLVFANAGASIITTRKGALRVMPDKEEVLEYMQ